MKREFLKSLGVDDNAIEQIMSEHKKELHAEQSKAEAKDAELKLANSTINGLREDIKQYEGADINGLKQKVSDWEQKYNNDINAERQKTATAKKEYALKDVLKAKGVDDPDYLIYKHGGVEKFAFDDENKPIGIDDVLKTYKESSPKLFSEGNENTSVRIDLGGAGGNPQGHSGQSANEQFNAMLRGALKE